MSTRPFEVDGLWIVEWATDAPSIGIFAYEPGDPNSTYPEVIAMRNTSGSGSSFFRFFDPRRMVAFDNPFDPFDDLGMRVAEIPFLVN